MNPKERSVIIETGKIIIKAAIAVGFLGLLSRIINVPNIKKFIKSPLSTPS